VAKAAGKVDFIIHGPPSIAPPVLAEAIRKGMEETAADTRFWTTIPKGDDPGVDAMSLRVTRPVDPDCLSTCAPVSIQVPLLRGMSLTHRQLTPLARVVSDSFFSSSGQITLGLRRGDGTGTTSTSA
jgi:hypothetical protein